MNITFCTLDPMLNKRAHRAGGAPYALAAYIKNKNPYKDHLNIDFQDFNSYYLGAINIYLAKIVASKPDIVAFSVYCWNVDAVIQIITNLKKMIPKVKMIVGGPEVSYSATEFIEKVGSCDIVVRGEGEITFDKVITQIYENKDLTEIQGITFRNDENIVIENEDRPIHPILDDFPSPYLTGIIDFYKSDGEVAYETVRGCPYRCSYCLHTKGLTYVRKYSMKRVKEEIEYILKSPYVRILWFLDPTFNADEKRALEILEHIESINPKIELAFEIRADLLTDALIEQLGKLNVVDVGIGLQSTSSESNEYIKRKNNIKQMEENIYKLYKAISQTCTGFDIDLIYGLPGDTHDTYKKSIDYVLSLNGNIYYQPLRIFKGTELIEDINKFNIKYNENPPYNVLSNKTYTYEDMQRSYCLNVGVDFYNSCSDIEFMIDKMVEFMDLTHSAIFEDIGQFYWVNNFMDVFRISNWSPDDRSKEVLWGYFNQYLLNFIKMNEKNSWIISFQSIVDRLRPINVPEDVTQIDHKATYFHLTI